MHNVKKDGLEGNMSIIFINGLLTILFQPYEIMNTPIVFQLECTSSKTLIFTFHRRVVHTFSQFGHLSTSFTINYGLPILRQESGLHLRESQSSTIYLISFFHGNRSCKGSGLSLPGFDNNQGNLVPLC